jgi:hypothetical protein
LASLTYAVPDVIYPEIIAGKLVAVLAVRLSRVLSARTFAPHDVRANVHNFHMVWIYAATITAQMINNKRLRDFTMDVRVGESVSHLASV